MRAFRWYVAFAVAALVTHLILPASALAASYTLISASTIVPLTILLRGSVRGTRLPWWVLLAAMTALACGSAVTAVFGIAYHELGDLIVTAGHGLLLASALVLVVRRGRNDVGGLIDAAVALMGLGSVVWTLLLEPRLQAAQAPLGLKATLLVSIFVLAGVLGALSRVWSVAEQRLPALHLLIVALLIALVGNTAMAMLGGAAISGGRPMWVEVLFLIAYLCVGSAALHPSMRQLARPGPVPEDRLSGARMIYLGAALVVSPVLGGGRELFGAQPDGLLIAFGALIVAPLVMLRIHRLAAQRRDAEEALLHQATHDALTGLPNRAELLRRLIAALAGDSRREVPRVALLFIDLDGFKAINDRLGHHIGDLLLIEAAARLRAALRVEETAARYGGDEFLVLWDTSNRAEATARICERIEQTLNRPFDLAGECVRIGASLGVALSDGRQDADALIRRADQKMYDIKNARRGAAVGAGQPALTGRDVHAEAEADVVHRRASLAATGNSEATATLLIPLADRVVVSNPSNT